MEDWVRRFIPFTFPLLVVAIALSGTEAFAEYSGRVESNARVCARHDVMKRAEGPVFTEEGKSYFFCFPRCLEQFKSDPKRFRIATDPVSGERVDKAEGLIYAWEGRVFYFSTEENLKMFSKEPSSYLARPSKRSEAGSRS